MATKHGNMDVIEAAVTRALAEAEADPSVDGARVTPFVLGRVNQLTDGAAVRSNVALVENNARVGADVAVALAEAADAAVDPPTYPPPGSPRPAKV